LKVKSKIFIIALILIVSNTFSQVNCVLNYSFEQHTNCGGILGCSVGTGVNNWISPEGFVNWYSFPCNGASSNEGVPQNFLGYQYARTGQSYAGILADTDNVAGYITGTLIDTLKSNVKYCVTFYVSLADSEWWAFSAIGAYLSNDSICTGTYSTLSYTPQIINPLTDTIKDKINWTPISGEFQANGGEKFMTIGTFHKLTRKDFDTAGPGGIKYGENSETQTYYYVDDVYVRELTIANAGKEDSICNGDGVVIGKDTTTAGVSFSWLPTTGLSNPSIAQPMASPTVTTTYTLTVVNDSIHGCNCADSVTKDSVTVFVYPAMHITNYFFNDTGSNSGSAGVYVTGGSKPYTYLWKPGGQTADSITGLGASIDTCIITDANGCTYTTQIVVKNTTGIEGVTLGNEQIEVYPNPNNGVFTLTFSHPELVSGSQATIEIYNVLGEKIYSQNIKQSNYQIDLRTQPDGVYFYRVLLMDGSSTGEGKVVLDK